MRVEELLSTWNSTNWVQSPFSSVMLTFAQITLWKVYIYFSTPTPVIGNLKGRLGLGWQPVRGKTSSNSKLWRIQRETTPLSFSTCNNSQISKCGMRRAIVAPPPEGTWPEWKISQIIFNDHHYHGTLKISIYRPLPWPLNTTCRVANFLQGCFIYTVFFFWENWHHEIHIWQIPRKNGVLDKHLFCFSLYSFLLFPIQNEPDEISEEHWEATCSHKGLLWRFF